MKSRSIPVLFAVLAFIFAIAANAQTFRGSIQGTVTDGSGAAIAGAQVKVFSPATGLSRTVDGQRPRRVHGLGAAARHLQRHRRETGLPHHDADRIPVSVGSPTRADAKLPPARSSKWSRYSRRAAG